MLRVWDNHTWSNPNRTWQNSQGSSPLGHIFVLLFGGHSHGACQPLSLFWGHLTFLFVLHHFRYELHEGQMGFCASYFFSDNGLISRLGKRLLLLKAWRVIDRFKFFNEIDHGGRLLRSCLFYKNTKQIFLLWFYSIIYVKNDARHIWVEAVGSRSISCTSQVIRDWRQFSDAFLPSHFMPS